MNNILEVFMTKCSCTTKTPELTYHAVDCKYKATWENYFNKESKMTKEDWINEANKYLVKLTGEWDYENNSKDYCESLYETYVEETGDDPFSPQDAVDEDMTYWED